MGHSTTNISQKSAGFTLIELLVATAIIGVLGITVAVNVRAPSQRADVSATANALIETINQARFNSLAGRQEQGVYPAGGYGIAIPCLAANDYCLFTANNALNTSDPAADQIISKGLIVSPVFISSLVAELVDGTTVPLQRLILVPQVPVATFMTTPSLASSATAFIITLTRQATGQEARVRIDAISGLVHQE